MFMLCHSILELKQKQIKIVDMLESGGQLFSFCHVKYIKINFNKLINS